MKKTWKDYMRAAYVIKKAVGGMEFCRYHVSIALNSTGNGNIAWYSHWDFGKF